MNYIILLIKKDLLMKKIKTMIVTLIILISVPFYTFADHLDVIQMELNKGCDFNQFMVDVIIVIVIIVIVVVIVVIVIVAVVVG